MASLCCTQTPVGVGPNARLSLEPQWASIQRKSWLRGSSAKSGACRTNISWLPTSGAVRSNKPRNAKSPAANASARNSEAAPMNEAIPAAKMMLNYLGETQAALQGPRMREPIHCTPRVASDVVISLVSITVILIFKQAVNRQKTEFPYENSAIDAVEGCLMLLVSSTVGKRDPPIPWVFYH